MTSVVEHEEVVKALKTRLEEKDEEITSLQSKVRKQDHFLQKLKDKIECPVCMEIPRSGPVPVCPNGHFVCVRCNKKASCPTCRTAMGAGRSLLAGSVLENIEHSCKFEDCNEIFPLEEMENHEVDCPYRTVSCPFESCSEEMPLSQLVGHLLSSRKCCVENEDPLELINDEDRRNYFNVKAACNTQNWRMHIFDLDSETFAVFPLKSEGHFYFVVVMFASETECANYKFQMIVHERQGDVDSETSVNFHGRPLSIDMKKDELKLYGISGKLMTRIVESSVCKSAFSLSFKIAEKENI